MGGWVPPGRRLARALRVEKNSASHQHVIGAVHQLSLTRDGIKTFVSGIRAADIATREAALSDQQAQFIAACRLLGSHQMAVKVFGHDFGLPFDPERYSVYDKYFRYEDQEGRLPSTYKTDIGGLRVNSDPILHWESGYEMHEIIAIVRNGLSDFPAPNLDSIFDKSMLVYLQNKPEYEKMIFLFYYQGKALPKVLKAAKKDKDYAVSLCAKLRQYKDKPGERFRSIDSPQLMTVMEQLAKGIDWTDLKKIEWSDSSKPLLCWLIRNGKEPKDYISMEQLQYYPGLGRDIYEAWGKGGLDHYRQTLQNLGENWPKDARELIKALGKFGGKEDAKILWELHANKQVRRFYEANLLINIAELEGRAADTRNMSSR